jgi:hypothetical protein
MPGLRSGLLNQKIIGLLIIVLPLIALGILNHFYESDYNYEDFD